MTYHPRQSGERVTIHDFADRLFETITKTVMREENIWRREKKKNTDIF